MGDHVRRRRLDLGLLQREVATLLGVSKSTMEGWERNRHPPTLKHIPAVVEFLGYVPFPEPVTLAERLRLYRRLNGISRRQLARCLQVDETTVWRLLTAAEKRGNLAGSAAGAIGGGWRSVRSLAL